MLLKAFAETYHNDCWNRNRCVRKKALSHTKTLKIDGTKYSTFQEAAGLSKSEELFFINEVLDDAASVMNLTEAERKDRILQKKKKNK
ncbi:hypothetical protein TNCV_2919641 [Trichonephila clavipes]|nr:hypothetical protein TNCV_2919641 [Trichonephila clavipes]